MPKIFISYRRSDSRAFSDRIYDHLITAFGDGNVFQDVDNIPAGADFRKVLQREIQRSDVVLVIIGPQWAIAADERGVIRLGSPADFVRIEVESALNSGKYVIPVLIDGANMPLKSDLPVELHELLFRNAARVRHNPDFKVDMERLIKAIQAIQPSEETGAISVSEVPIVLPDVGLSAPIPDLSSYNTAVLKHLPQPFEWCYVSDGDVILETNPAKLETVAAFAIAKYPITNAQFQTFIESRDGYLYEKDYHWYNFSEQSREYRLQNPKPKSEFFAGDDIPRTNLSWFDAIAFSRWLSHRLGITITLPTEQQWQRAAIGDHVWQYPWGNQFDANRCNTKESAIGHPVAVTEYLNGQSPFGVFQMCGNVYDWCLNDYHQPDDARVDAVTSERAVRGGSWVNTQKSTAIVTHRRDAKPENNGNDNVGFRIMLVLPL